MSDVNRMPREEGLDHTVGLVREGYLYISNRRRGFQSDVFETRLLGKKAICMAGKEAAELFYDNEKFKRKGAAPPRVMQSLFGKNGVQALDGEAHKHRKAMFMSMMSPDALKKLSEITREEWESAIAKWEGMDEVILYKEAQEIMCRTACRWAGVPVPEQEVKNLAQDLTAMIEATAKVGPPHWKGRNARNRVEKWVGDMVEKVRDGRLQTEPNTVLHTFSWHRDHEGKLLPVETAAVEIINILRPIVAVAIYINFTALAVHHYPEEREKLASGDSKRTRMFVQEVRRFYPFFPFAAAIVKKDFTWKGYLFEKGALTLLDLYGTNHDPAIWDNPGVFNPDRFADWQGSPFDFIPQGGGDHFMGHRCAGEWVTIELMQVSLDYLANRLDYEVPDQDISYSMVDIPSIPRSNVRIKNVKRK
ncbi:MAG: cytochrome P450 [Bacillus sp. (in: firmicutes)]